ncbi:ATP-binding protein [Desulfohalovibrio reitneri]|uniref:ATP-binding protein n=1 Tax=Desulfohalovibrio reitneri TaxID=1307759 RepID=UPI0004A6CE2C|nr:ATP-binding protein [Desulfohalovibrio reitneri]
MPPTELSDLVGIEHSKLGYFHELQLKLEELKAANMETENRRQEIAAILDGITDVMMVLSENLKIISVNHVFRELFDDPAPEGKYCYQIFRGQDHPCPECPAFKSLSTNTVCKETAFFRINGVNRQYEMVASPIKNQDLPEYKVLIFKRDVTLEKEYQAKYYHAEKMATVGVLATGVAHEVNNPLMAISGYAEGIQRRLGRHWKSLPGELAGDLEEYTQTILRECQRCQQIVNSMLNFGHPEATTQSPVNINDVVMETLHLLHYHLKKRQNLTMRTELARNLPFVHGNAAQLKQVFLNLLTNAIDAIGEEEGVITVQSGVTDGMVRLEISDTGQGISADIRGNLFDPFFTTKPAGNGIGIGLSTCYTIVVKEHAGDIRLESEVGKGSTFIVDLPVPREEDDD